MGVRETATKRGSSGTGSRAIAKYSHQLDDAVGPLLEGGEFPVVLGGDCTTIAHLSRPELDGFWIHIDADCLDDAVMPAVDFRLSGGLSPQELETVLKMGAQGRS